MCGETSYRMRLICNIKSNGLPITNRSGVEGVGNNARDDAGPNEKDLVKKMGSLRQDLGSSCSADRS